MFVRPLLQPWFLVFSLGLGTMGTYSALGVRRDRGPANRKDAMFLVAIAWAPVVLWILAQFYGER